MVKQIVIGSTKINKVNSPSFRGKVDHRHNDVLPVPRNNNTHAGAHATPELDLRGSLNQDTDEDGGSERGPYPSAASKYEMICPTPACFPASLSQLNIVKYDPF